MKLLGQVQVFGRIQVPPFAQSGEHTAKNRNLQLDPVRGPNIMFTFGLGQCNGGGAVTPELHILARARSGTRAAQSIGTRGLLSEIQDSLCVFFLIYESTTRVRTMCADSSLVVVILG